MKSKLLLLIILLPVIFFSCKKFLNKPSDNSLAVPSTLNDLQGLLDDGDEMNDHATPSFGEAYADNYFLPPATYAALRNELQETYTWMPHYYITPNDWSYGYLPVYNSNYCLDILPGIPVTAVNAPVWNNIKGSALFFRAYYFLQLIWVYGKAYDSTMSGTDLGIVLRLTSDFNIKSARSTVSETYARVITDAKESVSYLPDLPAHPYRPSKAAAYGLLARTYLSMRQYDSAFKYVNLCLGLQSNVLDYNDGSINAGGNVPFQPFNEEIIFFTSMNSINSSIATNIGKTDTSLYDSYDSNDLRKQIFFRLSSGYQRFKGSYAASVSELFSGIAVDEMILTRAECYARTNDVTDAMADLNTLISKRWANTTPYINFTATTPTEALNEVLLERRKELLFRGLRWMDIKRLNKEGVNIVLTRNINGNLVRLSPNDNRYALPLPSDIISETGLPQNPQ